MKVTPVLYVEAIEPCLPFWVDRVGFEKTVEVPHGDRLGFVILVKGGCEVMLQTWASAEADDARLLRGPRGMSAALFVEVDDFADIRRRLEGADVVVPERTTFYGMREIFVSDPAGHIVGFAAPEK
ncbi:MAG TPA: VOC family protein [Anaeromyxobacter sp.]